MLYVKSPFLNLYVKFALYGINSLQPFNVIVKPNKFTCFYIDQQAFNEKTADFYENLNDLEHFQKAFSFSRSANNQFL